LIEKEKDKPLLNTGSCFAMSFCQIIARLAWRGRWREVA